MSAVIDANCWCLYVDELIGNQEGLGSKLYEKAGSNGGILFDSGNLIRQQYIDMRKPYAEQIFDNWLGERVVYGAAKLVDVKSTATINKKLTQMGLPSKEHIFFKTAITGGAGHLISIDSDFFDVSAKKYNQEKKLSVIKSGDGPVCKAMKSGFKIKICCPESYLAA